MGAREAGGGDVVDTDEGFWATFRRSIRWNVLRRTDGWVEQTGPVSCGAAALTMLLRAIDGGDRPAAPLLADILAATGEDQEASLADLQACAVARGYLAHAYALSIDDLFMVDRPAVVHWRSRGRGPSSGHFVVLRGWGSGHVLVVDPARGNRFWPVGRFRKFFCDASGEGRVLYVAPSGADWLPLDEATLMVRAVSSASPLSHHWHRYF
ncbi:MAG: cysteine peptidase family C39 domain-containing protein [Thioalkalivibrionaceae bacterium]